MSAEVDILKDGSLDYPDNILEKAGYCYCKCSQWL